MIMFFRPLNALLYKGREHKPPEKMGEEAILRHTVVSGVPGW